MTSCHAMLNVGRSIGDEPFLIAQLTRTACRIITLGQLERVLAKGEVPVELLERMQQLLERDEPEPLLLFACRGERGSVDGLIQRGRFGHVVAHQRDSLAPPLSESEELQLFLQAQIMLKHIRAVPLRRMNRLVEIAALPLEEQTRELGTLERNCQNDALCVKLYFPVYARVATPIRRGQAGMRCMIAVLAVERYRRASGHWPDNLGDLVPLYVTKVPLDPFDGQPLRYRRIANGVVVYSVGADRVDDGGNLTANPFVKGTDWGHRLWDVAWRRQPPRPAAPPPERPAPGALPRR